MPKRNGQTTDEGTSSFENSLAELEKIVLELETGDIPLDRSLQLYEQGTKLSRQCQERLRKAEERIEALTRESGGPTALPIDDEEPSQRESPSDLSDDDIPF
jgi:exodeoxyribonuclease VII small subunit